MTELSVESISPELGARVYVAPDHLLDEGVPEQCLELLNKHGVLVFPAIGISDELQVEFSNRVGKMKPSKIYSSGNGEEKSLGIYKVTMDPKRAKFIDYIVSNEYWHMDGTSYAIPPKATNLKCEMPSSSGGDTEFANLYLAYEQLPAEKKAQIDDLKVVHGVVAANLRWCKNPSLVDLERWMRDGPATEQPLVWKQADGRSALVVGSTADHIVGMDLDEGRALLKELLDWCTQPQFCYRHQWQQGDMVIWNNPGLLHRAHPYTQDSGRLMHRTTITGTEALS
ncbi:TauD/TfdA dioxygenase family protein [Pseudomaricurvus sp.]|uniref:TauD/TfdA dioxygenase family protein n=1 Tax=Pseudomaricurvus sp. TaxID=2004510 RepID=UPI003F6B4AFB